MDLPTKKVNVVFHTDFAARGRYIANGSLLSTPIDGDGDFLVNLSKLYLSHIYELYFIVIRTY